MRTCKEAWLVSPAYELPTDARVAYDGTPPFVGCNHLICGSCGAAVRHVDDRATPSAYRNLVDVQALYEMLHPERSALLTKVVASRAYFCRCDWADVAPHGAKWLYTLDQQWSCGGHG